MKFSAFIKQLFTGACVYFSIVALLMIFIGLLSTNEFTGVKVVPALRLVLLFPFGLLLSAGQMLLKTDFLSKALRLLLHYIVTLVAFLLFLLLPANPNAKAGYYLIGALLVSVVYWIGYLIVALTKKRFHGFKEE